MRKLGTDTMFWFFLMIHRSGGTPPTQELLTTEAGVLLDTEGGIPLQTE